MSDYLEIRSRSKNSWSSVSVHIVRLVKNDREVTHQFCLGRDVVPDVNLYLRGEGYFHAMCMSNLGKVYNL